MRMLPGPGRHVNKPTLLSYRLPQTQNYTYDNLNRLLSASASGGNQGIGDYSLQTYTFETSTGNLASKAGAVYTYGNSLHPHAVMAVTGGGKFSYDANGNMLSKTYPSPTTYTYNAENRLASVSGAASASFLYDGNGQRFATTINGATTVYIGQISHEAELGLYFYKARYYNPMLSRWIQPDTLVPDPANPLDWDRYQYVQSNPLRWIDPSGNKACEGRDAGMSVGSSSGCSSADEPFTNSELEEALDYEFGWEVIGNWSNKELMALYVTGHEILAFANQETDGRGEEWMRKYLGGVKFAHGNFLSSCYELGGTVYLADWWLSDRDGPGYVLAHELAHYIDDVTGKYGPLHATWYGGGIGDALMQFVGGTPMGLRWFTDPGGIQKGNLFQKEVRNGYGNGSTADYFAEAFAWTIYNQANVPNEDIALWVKSVVNLQVNN